MSQLTDAVRLRARQRCEYCMLPQGPFDYSFQIEHIVARQHGGSTVLENLALACRLCNRKKGPNLAGIDPLTGHLTVLFNPRIDNWLDHFAVSLDHSAALSLEVYGLTAIGRTTAYVLGFSERDRPALRYFLNKRDAYRWPGV